MEPNSLRRCRKAPRLSLTARDLALLRLVTARRGVPIEHLAEELFGVDPYTKERNANPLRACERRLRALVGAGYLALRREHDGQKRRQVVLLGTRANAVVGDGASRRRVPVRNRAHHVRTQDMLGRIRASVLKRGGTVHEMKLEADIRSAAQKGKRGRRGQSYPSFPDAVCTVEMPGRAKETLAVEYVTSKYTSADCAGSI